MTVLEKLERRAKELDRKIYVSSYNQQIADDRDLLELAAKVIREYEPAFVLNALRAGKFKNV